MNLHHEPCLNPTAGRHTSMALPSLHTHNSQATKDPPKADHPAIQVPIPATSLEQKRQDAGFRVPDQNLSP